MKKNWASLIDHHKIVKNRKIVTLFEENDRFSKFSAKGGNIFLDYSKTNLDLRGKSLLIDMLNASGFVEKRKKLFSGKKINWSENRPVLHTALRSNDDNLTKFPKDITSDVKSNLSRMVEFCDDVRNGKIKSSAGAEFTDVINVGIGGSDLGPKLVTFALRPYHTGPKCHYVSNIDEEQIKDVLQTLNPKTTLVVLTSKSFKTMETVKNSETIINWFKKSLGENIEEHLVAISSNIREAQKIGIKNSRLFSFSNGVGGRFSLWGPVGLTIMLAIGPEKFFEFLNGAKQMDEHFLSATAENNIPVLLALIGVWHRNFCNYPTRAILPYEHRLSGLPEYLQQLDMESNGKRTTSKAKVVKYHTAPVVWGQAGTPGQHAFFQMLHQGTSIVPCEFLMGAHGFDPVNSEKRELLNANCLAQSEALMVGKESSKSNEIPPHKQFPGNRPSITLLYPKLTSQVLGSLLSLFEHRTFVEGIIWNVNSFDQWGVELGKSLSLDLINYFNRDSQLTGLNSSTAGLIKEIRNI